MSVRSPRPMDDAHWQEEVLREARRLGAVHDRWLASIDRLRCCPSERIPESVVSAVEEAADTYRQAERELSETLIGLWLRRRAGLATKGGEG